MSRTEVQDALDGTKNSIHTDRSDGDKKMELEELKKIQSVKEDGFKYEIEELKKKSEAAGSAVNMGMTGDLGESAGNGKISKA
jgi:hypothetical protein